MEMPDGVSVAVENNTQVIVSGIDKEAVGNIAAKIREVRPPNLIKVKGFAILVKSSVAKLVKLAVKAVKEVKNKP
jgi:large subunit ribosomal protein L6